MSVFKTKILEVIDNLHGKAIRDPYRWLEETSNPEVDKWVDQQDANARSLLENTPARANIKRRLADIFNVDSFGVPWGRKGRYFFMERKGTDDLSKLFVQDGLHGIPRVLIDENQLSQDKTMVIHNWSSSVDGKLLAYSLSKAANDQAAVYVMDVDTGKNLSDFIPAEIYPSPHTHFEWSPDGKGFWYSHRHPDAPKGEEKFHQKIYYHKLGDDYKNDEMIFGDTIAKEDIPWAEVDEEGHYMLVTVGVHSAKVPKTELYLYDLRHPEKGFIPIVKDIDALFYARLHRGMIYIHTNHNTPFWSIMAVNIEGVGKGITEWKVIIPEGKYLIERFVPVNDYLFVPSLENVHAVLRLYKLDGTYVSEIPLPTLGSLTRISAEEEGSELFFGFTSFLIPHTIYRYDLAKHASEVFRKVETRVDAKLFDTKQVWYTSKGGTKVPMFLIHKKNLKLDGNNPTLLYGYGGFNIAIKPSFLQRPVPFLESGGIYAIASLRGGEEFGEEWHKAGMREKKQNVFDDFITAAEWLIENRYTNSSKLAIFGWSNGGLLVGAAITQRPELYKAAIIGAPVTDMIRYHLFFGGRHWIPEYGSSEEKEMLPHLLAYSPYHNVKDNVAYPATLIVTADSDDRVHPMHAYKMAARLQAANNSDSPILLRVDRKAGHSAAPAVSREIELYADIYGFLFDELGVSS